jgi:predicted NAD/FAD-dependent oxidoreductase
VPLAPHSPVLASLAALARMRAAWALMLRYDAPLELHFDAAFVNHGPLRWVARDSHKPGRGPRRPGCSTPPPVERGPPRGHARGGGRRAAGRLRPARRRCRPAAWSAHRWRYADTEASLDRNCCWDEEARIGLCGDWLNGGKVEGAWLSGRGLARRIGAAASVIAARP